MSIEFLSMSLLGRTPEGRQIAAIMNVTNERVLDRSSFPGDSTDWKEWREALQVEAFLGSLLVRDVKLRRGEDPPDFILNIHGVGRKLEVTQLSLVDLRGEYNRARRFESYLEIHLAHFFDGQPHLEHAYIEVSISSAPRNRDFDPLRSTIETRLRTDLGLVGDGIDFSQGLPDRLSPAGFYGEIGDGILLTAQRRNDPSLGRPRVSLLEVSFTEDDLLSSLYALIERKDKLPNEWLLISLGAPDEEGYVCPADIHLFGMLKELKPAKPHTLAVDRVFVHLWNSFEALEIMTHGTDALTPGGL